MKFYFCLNLHYVPLKKKRWDLKILLHGNSKNFVFECQNNNFTITKQQ